MFLPASVKIFMSDRPVDMRLGIDGLFSIVRQTWQHDVFSGHLFVFVGSGFDRAKILFWDKGGFVLYYKRLEQGRFKRPKMTLDQQAIELDKSQLFMLLDGIDFTQTTKKRLWSPKRALSGSTS
jgi:transposase